MSERPHWYPAYVGLGSNLQMPTRQVENAIDLLGGIPRTRLVTVSSLYRSAPFGGIEQPDFVNGAAALLTQLAPHDLLGELQDIEARQGREREDKRWGPRVLDLDLLVHAAAVIDEPGITLPHPGIAERNFVLLPLLEIAPELVIPGLGRVVAIPVNWDEPSISRIA
jgi:2-amino-4-hydroxy-6-hydroxymethyldihydropteridine diphosphokinase